MSHGPGSSLRLKGALLELYLSNSQLCNTLERGSVVRTTVTSK